MNNNKMGMAVISFFTYFNLDFASGDDFNPDLMGSFAEVLYQEIGEAYGLEVEVKAPKAKEPAEIIHLARWRARMHVPQVNLSASQSQI